MRTLTSLALITSLVTTTVSAAPDPRSGSRAPLPASRSIDLFSAKLHAQVGARSGNLVYSPSSIAIALAMVREGARGQTLAELDQVLGADIGVEARALAKSLTSSPKTMRGAPELSVANRLFGDQQSRFERPFLELLRDGYSAPLETLDFRHRFEDGRARINAWVEKQTRQKITDLLPRGSLNEETRLVLVNAIYLKAQWAAAFRKELTMPAKFTVLGRGDEQVPTMSTRASAAWGAHAGARILDLPYAAAAAPGGPRLSMMLVVPETAQLSALEAAYASSGLSPFSNALVSHGDIDVELPKFRAGTTIDLGAALQAMGIRRAFGDDADFSGIANPAKDPLKISRVIHKAWIEVDEKGTEAAAATGIVMGVTTTAVPLPVSRFAVDRSFLFFIHDEHGTVLFGGRVMDPTAS
jgi:serine protease inhibitor